MAYLLSTSEVNANKAMTYFGGAEDTDELTFRQRLAKQLIFNKYLQAQEELAVSLPN